MTTIAHFLQEHTFTSIRIPPPPTISSDIFAESKPANKPYSQMSRREQKLLDRLNQFGACFDGEWKKEKRAGDTHACYHIDLSGNKRTFRTLDELECWFVYKESRMYATSFYTFEQILEKPARLNTDQYKPLEGKMWFKRLLAKSH